MTDGISGSQPENLDIEISEEESPAKSQRSIFRRRSFWLWVGGFIVVAAAITVAALLLVSQANERREAREALESGFSVAADQYSQAFEELSLAVTKALPVAESTTPEKLADVSPLEALKSELAEAQSVMETARGKNQLDVAAASNADLETQTKALVDATPGLSKSAGSLESKTGQVQEAIAAKIIADQKARAEAQKAEKRAAAQPISYEDLFRAGDSLKGNYYKFEGKVIQDAGSDSELASFRVSITADQGYSRVFWKDTIMIAVKGETAQKILEDDIISFTGASGGLFSYKSVMGATIEVPLVIVEGADVAVTGRDN